MKTDIRIIKSREAIENAFLELVETNGYRNVKLIDIAEKARVNRNTIYLHYGSKEGIVEQIIKNAVESENKDFDLEKYLKSKNSRKRIEHMYRAIFTMFGDNLNLYRLLLTDDQLIGFLYRKLLETKKILLKSFRPTTSNEIGIDFLLNGVFGVLSNYTVYAKGTAEENIKLLTDFTIINLRRLA